MPDQDPELLPKVVDIQNQVLLSRFTTLHIGGPAKHLAIVTQEHHLLEAIVWAQTRHIPWVVIGRGSNLLVHDLGFDGLVIVNRIEYESWMIEEDRASVTVGAGTNLAAFAARCSKNGWAGLEFACGIPASVGGAVCMNAGAHGCDMQSLLREVRVYREGRVQVLTREQCHFTYRSSRFHHHQEVVIAATFCLKKDSSAMVQLKQFRDYRLMTQPWKEATAGCFFRNPEALIQGEKCSTGALIERLGLKGYQIGQAQVSPKHASFLINLKTATAADFLELCSHIKGQIKERFGIELKGEVQFLDYHASHTRAI